jgi:protein tyrosine/serine phosphatase
MTGQGDRRKLGVSPLDSCLPAMPRPASLAKRAVQVVSGLAASAVLIAGGVWLAIQGDGNVHVLEPAVAVRAAQPSAERLEDIVRRYGVRSVVNLRGPNAGTPWYDEEVAASKRLGLQHVDIALSARQELTPAQLDAVLALVDKAPKPVLIHCNGGSDRTGLVSAAWLYSRGTPAQAANEQLALRYGHFPWLGSKSVAMDRSLAAFEARKPH